MRQFPQLLDRNWHAQAPDGEIDDPGALVAEQIDLRTRRVLDMDSTHAMTERIAMANMLLVRFYGDLPPAPRPKLLTNDLVSALWHACHTGWAMHMQDLLWPDHAVVLVPPDAGFSDVYPLEVMQSTSLRLMGVLTLTEWDVIVQASAPVHQSWLQSFVRLLHRHYTNDLNAPRALFEALHTAGAPTPMAPYVPQLTPAGLIVASDIQISGLSALQSEGSAVGLVEEFDEDDADDESDERDDEGEINVPEAVGYMPPDAHTRALDESGTLNQQALADREGRTYKARAYRKRALDSGPRLRNIHRLLSDDRIFLQRRRAPGGSLLIDTSGSMSIDVHELMQLLEARPATQIALYSGRSESGTLSIIARRGRALMNSQRISQVLHQAGKGNIVDVPSLLWLAQQPRPRWWICDGVVTGRGDVQTAAIVRAAQDHATGVYYALRFTFYVYGNAFMSRKRQLKLRRLRQRGATKDTVSQYVGALFPKRGTRTEQKIASLYAFYLKRG